MNTFIYKKKNHYSWYARHESQHVSEEIQQVYLELSTFCNFSCETCMRSEIPDFSPRHFTQKNMDILLPMLKNLPLLKRIVLLGFGESMCNPHFEALMRGLRSIDTSIVMVTNLSLFNDHIIEFLSGLPVDEIWVSWDDSLNGDKKQVIRRGADDKTFKRNIESLIEIRNLSRRIKKVGLEVVASKMNFLSLPDILSYAYSVGIDECIVTNVFPYSERMKDEILYSIFDKKIQPDMKKLLPRKAKKLPVRFPVMTADRPRRCPFIEKGTIFITSSGEVAPCPELAYTHPAFYFGSKRIHTRQIFGSIKSKSIDQIWSDSEFSSFREIFMYYKYPDCSTCYDPDMCWNRTVKGIDCLGFYTPCGECLWAKDIIICP